MAEDWRRRSYYRPRVLIGVEDTLSSPYDGELVCLEASELNILRNLMQYAHRRANWVSEYHTDYYLVPDVDEWDDVEALVDELEGKLMGCSELTTAITEIAAAINCICEMILSATAQSAPPEEGYDGQPQYDDYHSPVVEDTSGLPARFADWDEFRTYKCIGAQKLIDDVSAAQTHLGIQLASGIFVTFSVINGLLLLSVIAAPVAIVIEIVTILATIGAGYAYADVVNWIQTNKQALVCAIYDAPTASAAYDAVHAYINDNWDIAESHTPTEKMFTYAAISDIFDGTMRNEADWISGYSDSYCTACPLTPTGVEFSWSWPPCENGQFLDGGVCWSGRKSFNGAISDATQEFNVDLTTWNQVTVVAWWRSCFPTGWTCGAVRVEWYDSGGPGWTTIATLSPTTTQPAGSLNTQQSIANPSTPVPGGLTRVRLSGQAAQGQSEPYPEMFEYVRVLFEDIP